MTGVAHQTVWKVLSRNGCSRRARALREPANRYEWPCPGDLLHMDVSRYARFVKPGHAVTGDRRSQPRRRSSAAIGYEYAHAIIDDHSRLAYVELHPDERAETVSRLPDARSTGTPATASRPEARDDRQRLGYTQNRALTRAARRREVRHLTTAPYRPRTNGKVERFHQTMAREWAYGLTYPSSSHRADALPHWLDHYNEQRPTAHSATGHPSAAFATSVGRTPSRRPRGIRQRLAKRGQRRSARDAVDLVVLRSGTGQGAPPPPGRLSDRIHALSPAVITGRVTPR